MIRKLLILGIVSGILAGTASIIYAYVYNNALGSDFSQVFTPVGVMITSVVGNVLASLGYFVLCRWLKDKTDIVFNLIFAVLSFATIVGPFGAQLPLEIETPELFPGLTVPMHFFPILAWLTLKPLFIKNIVS